MASNSYSDDEPISAINVTPLVDVMMVLLVIFMITAPALYQSAIKVNLPKAQTGQETDQNSLQFTLTQQGEVIFKSKKISWDELEKDLVKDLEEKGKEIPAVIRADEATPHGVVIKLMDLLRKLGLNRFALSVEKKSP